jgi:hypothetical protein
MSHSWINEPEYDRERAREEFLKILLKFRETKEEPENILVAIKSVENTAQA